MQSLSNLRQKLASLGAKQEHIAHILRTWLHARPLESSRRRIEHYLPLALRNALPELQDELASLARLHSEHPGSDTSSRLLIALRDGQTVESVLLPGRSVAAGSPSGGLCVSTQVGCAVACTFCKTGEGGLLRQMGSAEIAAQLALARSRRAVNKVVFMGMGEPAHNLDAVMEAIDAMGLEGGIGHKNLVLSTVGDRRLFERLLARAEGEADKQIVKPALALSLHTTQDSTRAALLPNAPRIPVQELLVLSERYARATHYPTQIQWALIEGVNDGDEEIEALIALLRGHYAILNMIPYNHVEGFAHRRPSEARCNTIFHTLNRCGVLTRMRQSAGQEVDAGCGQLRSRSVQAVIPISIRSHASNP